MAYTVKATVSSNNYLVYFYYKITSNSYTSGAGKSTLYFDFIIEEQNNYEFETTAFSGHSLSVNGSKYSLISSLNTNDDVLNKQYSLFSGKKVDTSSTSYSFPKSCTITHNNDGSASFKISLDSSVSAPANGYGPGKVTLSETTVTKGFSSLPYKYIVTYNANGGNGKMNTSTATYNTNFKTTKNAFTRVGYKFIGWNEKADGSGTAWGITSSDNGTYESGVAWKWTYTKDITLYAQWQAYKLTVTYNCNGATSIKYEGKSQDITSYVITQTFNYGTKYNTGLSNGNNLSYLYCTKTGHHFTEYDYIQDADGNTGISGAWNTKADGSGISEKWNPDFDEQSKYYGEYLAGKFGLDLSTGDKEITLYYEWEANKLTVHYNTNGATHISQNGVISTLSGDKITKYIYEYTEDNTQSITIPTFATESNKLIKYFYKFYNNTSDNPGVWSLSNNSLMQSGSGLYWGSTLATRQFIQNVGKMEELESGDCEVTLYVYWVPNTLTIIYQGNKNTSYTIEGSTIKGIYTNTQTFNYSDTDTVTLDALEDMSRTGYNNLKKWAISVTSSQIKPWSYSDTVHNICDYFSKLEDLAAGDCTLVLYNAWTPITYTIKYDPNGGIGNMADTTYTYDIPFNLSANIFTRDGYEFVGWSIYSDAIPDSTDFTDQQQVSGYHFSADGSVTEETLYAIWLKTAVINRIYVKHTDGKWYRGELFVKNNEGKWYKSNNIYINENGVWI